MFVHLYGIFLISDLFKSEVRIYGYIKNSSLIHLSFLIWMWVYDRKLYRLFSVARELTQSHSGGHAYWQFICDKYLSFSAFSTLGDGVVCYLIILIKEQHKKSKPLILDLTVL